MKNNVKIRKQLSRRFDRGKKSDARKWLKFLQQRRRGGKSSVKFFPPWWKPLWMRECVWVCVWERDSERERERTAKICQPPFLMVGEFFAFRRIFVKIAGIFFAVQPVSPLPIFFRKVCQKKFPYFSPPGFFFLPPQNLVQVDQNLDSFVIFIPS